MNPVIKSTTRARASAATATTGNLSVAAGDLIVTQVFGSNSTANQSTTDSQSNAYTTRLADDSFGGSGCSAYTALAASTSGTFTVTGHVTGSGNTQLQVIIIDGTTILGSSPFYDVGATSNDAGASVATADSGNTAACAGGDELVLGLLLSGTSTTASAGAGFSLDGQTAGTRSTVLSGSDQAPHARPTAPLTHIRRPPPR